MPQYGYPHIGQAQAQAGFRFAFLNRVQIQPAIDVFRAGVYLDVQSTGRIRTVIYADRNGRPGDLVFASPLHTLDVGTGWYTDDGWRWHLAAGVYWVGTLYEGNIAVFYDQAQPNEQMWMSFQYDVSDPLSPFPANDNLRVEGLVFSQYLEGEVLPQPQILQMSPLSVGLDVVVPAVSVDDDSGRGLEPATQRILRL